MHGNTPGFTRKASNQLPRVTRGPLTISTYGLHLSLELCQDLQGLIHSGPPCTAFSRYAVPAMSSPSAGGTSSREVDDPWAAPAEPSAMIPDQQSQSAAVTLPPHSMLMQDNRPVCAQLCNCPAQCVLTNAGHTRHFCGACIYRRRRGDPRSGT